MPGVGNPESTLEDQGVEGPGCRWSGLVVTPLKEGPESQAKLGAQPPAPRRNFNGILRLAERSLDAFAMSNEPLQMPAEWTGGL